MGDLSAARIRLEGSLEVIEEATRALEHAAAQLEQGSIEGVARALRLRDEPRTLQARVEVEGLAADEPALEAVMERFSSAKRALVEKVTDRAGELGLPGESADAAAEVLANDPVLYEGRLVPWAVVAVLPIAGVVGGLVTWNQKGSGLFMVVTFSIAAALFFTARRVVVTQRRVCIGPQVVPVSEVRSLRVTRVVRRTFKGGQKVHYELAFDCGDRGERTLEIPFVPSPLRVALTQLGFACQFPP